MRASLLGQNAELESVRGSVVKRCELVSPSPNRVSSSKPTEPWSQCNPFPICLMMRYPGTDKILHRLEFKDGVEIDPQGQDEHDPGVYVLANQRVVAMVRHPLEG
jgi:hypothetical protein